MTGKTRPFFSTSFFTILGRAGGFLIPFFVAAVFGAGHETDAFFFAYGLIFALSGVFNYIFESVLVPYLSEHSTEDQAVVRFANTVLLAALPAVALAAYGLGRGLPFFLIRGSGWQPETAYLVEKLFLEMLPMLVLGIWISQANSLFYHRKNFWFAAFSPLIRSLIVIGFLFGFHGRYGIHILSWGFSAGEVLRWIVTLVLLKKETPWQPWLFWKGPSARVREFFQQAAFQMLALLAVHLIVVADQWFAGRLGVGALSYLTYADRLLQVAYIFFLSGMLQVFLSYWADAYHREPKVFWEKIQKDIRSVAKIAVPLALMMWLFRYQAVFAVFHFSKISREEMLKVAEIFGWFVVGFVPGLIRLLYGRLLLVIKKSGFYCFQSWVELGLNIIFNFIFSFYFGVAGIAMSTTMIYFISMIWLYLYLKQHRLRVAA